MKKFIFVLCEGHRQFESWCRENSVNPNKHDIRYLRDPMQLRGLEDFVIFKWGTYYKLPMQFLDEVEMMEKLIEDRKPPKAQNDH